MYVPRCRHIKTNGTVCGSPSLRGQEFCYHHHLHQTHHARCHSVSDACLPLLTVEDTRSVQVALSLVFNSLTSGMIDQALARTLIYGLQVASSNARRLADEEEQPESLVRETSPGHPWTLLSEPGDSIELDLPDPPPLPDPQILLNFTPQQIEQALDRLSEQDLTLLESIAQSRSLSLADQEETFE
jgi:hypothetical protein